MDQVELERRLNALIDLELYKIIVAIRDGKFPNEEEMINETIQSYISKLPNDFKQIPNLDEFVKRKLRRADKIHQQEVKMRKEHDKSRRSLER